MERSELSPEHQEYITILKHASETLLNLINDVLDLSKIEAGELELVDQVFRVEEFINRSVTFLSRRADEKGVELLLDVDSQCPARIVGDPRRLQQIVVNLVGNAVKFTEKGEVVLRVRPINFSGDRATLEWEVEDTGPGIPPEDQEKIFESYGQSRSGFDRAEGGTGLGLAISSHLVERMGGDIYVESEPGEGSVFGFRVPFALPDDAEASETVLTQFRGEADSIDLAGRRVLVTDDHPTSRRIFRTILEEWGAHVVTAGDGKEAIDHLANQSDGRVFDLIILDRVMAGQDGFDVLDRIRDRGLTENIVIMVTSDNLKGDLRRAESLGVEEYLLKPVSRERLLSTLLKHFSEEDGSEASPDRSDVELYTPNRKEPVRILIADDSKTNRRILEQYLEDQPVKIDLAENGKQAVSSFRTGDYDLVFMDLRMPEMDGLEAVREIRSLEEENRLEEAPILALSGDVLEERKREALESGFDAFVEKPVARKKLLEFIQEWAIDGAERGSGSDR